MNKNKNISECLDINQIPHYCCQSLDMFRLIYDGKEYRVFFEDEKYWLLYDNDLEHQRNSFESMGNLITYLLTPNEKERREIR